MEEKPKIDLEGVKKFNKKNLKQTITKVPTQASERDGLLMNIKKGKDLAPTKTVNTSQERTETLHSIQKGVNLQHAKTVNLTEDRRTVLQDIQKGGVNLKKSVTHDAAQERRDVLSEIKKGVAELKHTETKDKSAPVVSLFSICREQQTEINELKEKLNQIIEVVEIQNKQMNYLRHNVGLVLNHTHNYMELIGDLRGRFDVAEPGVQNANISKPPSSPGISKVLESINNFNPSVLKKSSIQSKTEERFTLLRDLQKGTELKKVETKDAVGERSELMKQLRKGTKAIDLKHVETVDKVEKRKGLLKDIRNGVDLKKKD